jgi:hypothetical protein
VRLGEPGREQPGKELFRAGDVWRLYGDDDRRVFRFWSPRWDAQAPYKEAVFDESFTKGRIILDPKTVGSPSSLDPLEFPLNELLLIHFLAAQQRGVLVHACGVVDADGQGYLFSGNSGNGKTTTARLWNQIPGVRILNDDRLVIVNQNGGFEMHGTPWHGEGEFALPEGGTIDRVFFLEHGARNQTVPISTSQAVAGLVSRSFLPFHNHSGLAWTLQLFEALLSHAPCHTFKFVPDLSAVDAVRTMSGRQTSVQNSRSYFGSEMLTQSSKGAL